MRSLIKFRLAFLLADVLSQLHGAEVRSAHGAEMGFLMTAVGQGDIVVSAGAVRVEGEIELVFPSELEACLGQGVITDLSTR